MPSASADPNPRESWLLERRAAAIDAFTARIPAIYQEQIALHPNAERWADNEPGSPASLFLTGSIGVGKTHTAWQASRRWIGRRFLNAYRGTPIIKTWRSTALFDALRPDGEGASPKTLIRTLQKADLLFIDDLAAARVSPTGWTQERLYEIFDERYINRRPVLITCDVLPNQISHVVGERVASRLAEMCRGGVLLLDGNDRRKGGEVA
jgi:DNA replication protein DnaC